MTKATHADFSRHIHAVKLAYVPQNWNLPLYSFNLNICNLRNLSLGNIKDTNKQVSKLLTKVPKT